MLALSTGNPKALQATPEPTHIATLSLLPSDALALLVWDACGPARSAEARATLAQALRLLRRRLPALRALGEADIWALPSGLLATLRAARAGDLQAVRRALPNACEHATAGCRLACLRTAGRGKMRPVEAARAWRAILWALAPRTLWAAVAHDIPAHARAAARQGKAARARLNTLSDVRIPRRILRLAEAHACRLYDYTKRPADPGEARPALALSWAETPQAQDRCLQALAKGNARVAVVLRDHAEALGQALRVAGKAVPIVDGTTHDDITQQPTLCVLALSPKGKAKADRSGFVLGLASLQAMADAWAQAEARQAGEGLRALQAR